MITVELFVALVGYYIVMYITPGPNNTMLTVSGIKFGFIRTIPHLFGIPTGHAIQLTLVCLGLGTIFETYPEVQEILKWIGSGYLLYLAWRMLGSLKVGNQDTSSPLKFYEAIIFQFVNPKAWVICITAVSLFFPSQENFIISIFFLVLISSFTNFPCISCWAIFGTGIKRFLKNQRIKLAVEWLMAILLLLTAISILFG
ncbi:MAG: Cysteine/O-acetylserine efflux protein [Alphaproteobacteria bacterium MarineAlpha5_Bin12]|nr:lysine transporter LysE [Pelagibacteraceae bacterium]PPR41364.1 MAG: Cysteine/O-acetylserine efflux protein [Alphaproteobacteria bacterium MarineAlpha5_Bin12]